MNGAARGDRFAPLFLFFSSALGIYLAVVHAAHRPIWFDEWSTLIMSSQQSLAAYFRLQPVDAQPPLGPLLIHFALRLALPIEISARLPSMVGYLLGGGATYLFVAREGMRLAAAVAATSFLLGGAILYASEARPYALMMGLVAVLLLCWQRAIWSDGAKLWIIGLGGVMAMLTLSHSYAFLFGIVPIGCGELVRWRQRRKFDGMVALAMFAGLLPMILVLWLSMRTKLFFLSRFHGAISEPARPNMAKLLVTIMFIRYGPVVIGLAGAIACILLARRNSAAVTVPRKFCEAEWAAVGGVFVGVVGCWGIAEVYTHYYFPRYGCASLVGVSILTGMAFSLRGGRMREAILWLTELCILVAVLYPPMVDPGFRARSPAENSHAAALGNVPADGETIVVASALQYQQAQWYAPAALRPRLMFVSDPAQALRTQDFVPELVIGAYSELGALGLPVAAYDPFVRDHPAFYVLELGDPGEWLPGALVRDGFHKVSGSELGVSRYQR